MPKNVAYEGWPEPMSLGTSTRKQHCLPSRRRSDRS